MGHLRSSADGSGLYNSGYHPIVVENAMNPNPSHFAHRTIGKNRGVLNRNVSLIIEPVRDPASQRFRRKTAFIHQHMKGMFVVIAAHTDRAQFFDKGFAVPKLGGHKTIPSPSRAISMPSCSILARSGEPGIKIGFVLLI